MEKNILITDDEPHIVAVIKIVLEEAGYGVWTADDGRSALTLLEHATPDLIILDLKMPRVTGYEVCRILQNDPKKRAIPVVILTASGPAISKEDRQKLAAIDYISKPFSPYDLLDRVHKILSNGSPQRK